MCRSEYSIPVDLYSHILHTILVYPCPRVLYSTYCANDAIWICEKVALSKKAVGNKCASTGEFLVRC